MKSFIAAFFAFLSLTLFAQDTELTRTKALHITVDLTTSHAELFVLQDSAGDIDHFEWRINKKDGEVDMDTFTAEDIRNGTVFKEGLPKKFLTITGSNFSEIYGGTIKLVYPQRFVWPKKMRSKTFDITRVENKWMVNHSTMKDIKNVHVIVNTSLGIPLGADEVRFSK